MGPIAAEPVPEPGGTVNFHARAWVDKRCKPAIYLWDLGDGRVIRAYSPTVRYDAPGTYEVTFTAIDSRGRSASRRVTVTIE
ncbi:MAG TPA: PKD domain-containing protein [Chloroflexota bacterium]|jgi:PKD repeat protein|nr:PKD domain-containing protein [Chloroflexota bacterium]